MQALKNMIGRAILNLINDAAATQTVTLEAQAGDVHDEVELFQPFGFSAHPPVAARRWWYSCGNHDHPIALCAEHKGTRRNNLAEAKRQFTTYGAQHHAVQRQMRDRDPGV
ncbi:phage baseplate assembly protein [Neisseria subflava]|uniref:phage baseplate assembly protein n=1 Tax=Neisseria subflava TaxID=28449 RepID=UPI00202A7AC1|nr:phage baseplate assembly protein [Neisseria subflava]MCL9788255.1 phage baseplate assembly protein [Neisseria subflava]